MRTVGTNETHFKFHRSVKIDAGAVVTVWSMDADQTHEPPAQIVMKQQKWFVGDNMKTVLLNGDAEEVAATERVRHQIRVSRHSYTEERPSSAAGNQSAIGRLFSFW